MAPVIVLPVRNVNSRPAGAVRSPTPTFTPSPAPTVTATRVPAATATPTPNAAATVVYTPGCWVDYFELVSYRALSPRDADAQAAGQLLAEHLVAESADGTTGFSVDDEDFFAYFVQRGGVRVFGYPISRPFTLFGYDAQMFEDRILVKVPDVGIAQLNFLENCVLPVQWFPAVDQELVAASPESADPDYEALVRAMVETYVADEMSGMPVGFLSEYLRAPDGFVTDLKWGLQTWGLPRSQATRDPNRPGLVYQRFEFGIMVYDDATGITAGLPLAQTFKAILRRGPQRLPATDLSLAFEP
jgi:hypothetical protein